MGPSDWLSDCHCCWGLNTAAAAATTTTTTTAAAGTVVNRCATPTVEPDDSPLTVVFGVCVSFVADGYEKSHVLRPQFKILRLTLEGFWMGKVRDFNQNRD